MGATYRSVINAEFLKLYRRLPHEVREQAREAYRQFLSDPATPGLRFKMLSGAGDLCSARVNQQYRVVGAFGDPIVWFWIGTHNAFDKRF